MVSPLLQLCEKYGVELRPDGFGRLQGLCPLHMDSKPSFKVYTENDSFHCFGCNQSGTAVDFLMVKESIPYHVARERLGDFASIQIDAVAERLESLRRETNGKVDFISAYMLLNHYTKLWLRQPGATLGKTYEIFKRFESLPREGDFRGFVVETVESLNENFGWELKELLG